MIKCFNCGCEIPDGEGRNYLEHTICEDCSNINVLVSLEDMFKGEGAMNELEECVVTAHKGQLKG